MSHPARSDTASSLEYRVRRRDRYSIEIKTRHLLEPGHDRYPRRRTTRTRLVFFLPYSFNIRPETLDPDDFYDDLKLYIRFNTPEFTLDELLDPASRDSPLARLVAALESETVSEPLVLYEARLLGGVVKSALRDRVARLLAEDPTEKGIEQFCATVDRLHRAFDRYRRRLDPQTLPPSTLEQLELVDEFLSLTIESYFVRLLTARGADAGRDNLRDAIVVQQRYRRERGYRSVVERGARAERREEYVYRYKRLKHYISTVLFFVIRRGNQAKRVEHLLYALAAGLAMAVATGIAYFGQIRFGSLSTTLFFVLVGSYMLKDRIKDAARAGFHSTLGRLFYDRRTRFTDPSTHRPLGVVKERTMFVPARRLEESLREARARGGFERAITSASPETVLEYTKLLRIYERRLHTTHRRISGLADTNIVDLKNLLRYLVRQQEYVPVLDGSNVELERTRRIYHLNLLLSVENDGAPRWWKVRLVVDSGGIRRIETP